MRKALSKKLRFEVFKRDGFACQYCGAHPPAAILECDHIVAVANGGDNDSDNLITACFNCNRGKSATPLDVVPKSLADKAAEVAEREAQVAGYASVMQAKRERLESDAWMVFDYWHGAQDRVPEDKFISVQRFVEKLGAHQVLEAVDIARGKSRSASAEWKYFCGVCWNMIREQGL